MLIEAGDVRNGFAGVFGRAGELEGLGSVEGCRETDLADLLGMHLHLISIGARMNVEWENLHLSTQT